MLINPTHVLDHSIDREKLPGKIFYSFLLDCSESGRAPNMGFSKKTSAVLDKKGLVKSYDNISSVTKCIVF